MKKAAKIIVKGTVQGIYFRQFVKEHADNLKLRGFCRNLDNGDVEVIVEGEKERIQMIEGVVIKMRGGGARKTLTVRKISFGVGVERIFPFHSPRVEKIEIVRRAKVRQAKLYYLRELRGKAARLKELKAPRPETKAKRVKSRGKKAKAAKAAAKNA